MWVSRTKWWCSFCIWKSHVGLANEMMVLIWDFSFTCESRKRNNGPEFGLYFGPRPFLFLNTFFLVSVVVRLPLADKFVQIYIYIYMHIYIYIYIYIILSKEYSCKLLSFRYEIPAAAAAIIWYHIILQLDQRGIPRKSGPHFWECVRERERERKREKHMSMAQLWSIYAHKYETFVDCIQKSRINIQRDTPESRDLMRYNITQTETHRLSI